MNLRPLLIALCAIFLTAFSPSFLGYSPQVANPQWSSFKNGADRIGRTDRIGPQTNQIAWRHLIHNSGIQSAAVIGHDGTVYVGTVTGVFYAFRPDGSVKWIHPISRFEITAAPAIGPDGTIYIMPENGDLHAFDRNGTLKWIFPMKGNGGPPASPVVGSDGTIYIGAERLYAVNPDGTLRWKYNTGYYMDGPPAIAPDGTIYVPSQGYLYALEHGGGFKWRVLAQSEYPIGSAPAIAKNGTIYANTFDGVLHAIAPDGSVLWTYKTEGIVTDVPSSPAIGRDGTIYFGGAGEYQGKGGYFYAVRPNGSLVWKYFAGCDQTAPSIDGDGTIYFGSNGCGTIHALNPDGTVKWSLYANAYMRSAPAIGAGNRLYAGYLADPNFSTDGGLLAIGP
jgi:outer membrane protein assembly factor BamB